MTRSTHTIELDDLDGCLQLTEDADTDSWPGASIELEVRWHPAEPDVGIFSPQSELDRVTYWLDSVSYADEDQFVADLYLAIGEDIEESQDELKEMISNRIENEELENEQ